MGKIFHLGGSPGVKGLRQTSTSCAPAWCKIGLWRTYRKAVLDHMQGYISIATEQLGSPFGGCWAKRHNQAKSKKEGIYFYLQQVRRGPGICYRVGWTWRTWYLSAAKMGSSVCSVQPSFRFSSSMGHGGARSPSLPCGCQGRMCALRDGRSPKSKENGAEIGTFHFSQAHQLYKLSLLS